MGISAAFRYQWIPKINFINTRCSEGLKSWIAQGTYSVISVIDKDNFIIGFADGVRVSRCFAHDADIMASSCFETFTSISEIEKSPRSLAWLVLKEYYASFYAAHALLRISGISCIQLDRTEVERVFDTAFAYGALNGNSTINSGLFNCYADFGAGTITFKKAPDKSHENLWAEFKKYLESVITSTSASLPIKEERDNVVKKLSFLQKNLCMEGKNGGNWLSYIRNMVNYRRLYGVWYPYAVDKNLAKSVVSEAEDYFYADPMKIVFRESPEKKKIPKGFPVPHFSQTCVFLSSCCRETFKDIVKRCPEGKSFAEYGSFAFLRNCKISL